MLAAHWSPTTADELLPRTPNEPDLAPDPTLPHSFVALSELYPARLATEHRKQRGAWFTPLALAQPTADRTLAPLLAATADPSRLRIVDPAVGGGVFLRAALRTLRAAGVPTATAVRCLHGVDIDPTAAVLAALAVWEECGDAALDPRPFTTRIHAGDGLVDLAAAHFDAVLTNPPWETLQSGAEAPARVRMLRPRFHHQGRGKLFTYRLFVERAHQLLVPGGRMGLVVPASLWFDRDAEPLRRLLLDDSDWRWLFGFENRRKVFAIDGRYRFGVVIATKGTPTQRVRVAFGRTELADWSADAPPHVELPREALRALSPASGAFVEADAPRDLDVLRRMQAGGTPLCGRRGAFAWQQGDFNMTSDREHFVLREAAEAAGHRRGDDGVWRRDGQPDLLPLYQGAMLFDLHPNVGAHAGGTGHATAWTSPASLVDLRPAYLVDAASWWAGARARPRARLVHRALSNATNERTTVVGLLPDVPCGNSLGVLSPHARLGPEQQPLRELAAAAAVLSSLPFDWALRRRLGGTNLNGFVLADCVLPPLADASAQELAQLALRLAAILPWHDGLWQQAAHEGWAPSEGPARTDVERAELATQIDVRTGRAFGLDLDDVAWITRDCERPSAELLRGRGVAADAKGFWRIDRTLPPPQRRPNRWRAAAARFDA